jgi:UDP-2-acetamido-2-deoxy-ribo-hexuluronate aminotransferase
MQAAVLLAKLAIFDDEVARRGQVGARYSALLQARGACSVADRREGTLTPHIAPDNSSVYAQYTLQADDRDASIARLQAAGIPTAVHYPIPLNRQAAYTHFCCPDCTPHADRAAARVFSLPMHPYLTAEDAAQVVVALLGDD